MILHIIKKDRKRKGKDSLVVQLTLTIRSLLIFNLNQNESLTAKRSDSLRKLKSLNAAGQYKPIFKNRFGEFLIFVSQLDANIFQLKIMKRSI